MKNRLEWQKRKINAKSLFEDGKHKFKVKVAHSVMQDFSSNARFFDERMEKVVGWVNLAGISPHNNKRCREQGARVSKEGKLWAIIFKLAKEGRGDGLVKVKDWRNPRGERAMSEDTPEQVSWKSRRW